jgi:hypothetical protein
VTIDTLAADNYALTNFVDAELWVTPATITVTADGKSKAYGDAVPALTYSYGGFVLGEDSSVITGTPTLNTTATMSSTVAGSPYPITVDVGPLSAANYQFAGVDSTVTVTPVPLTVMADAGASEVMRRMVALEVCGEPFEFLQSRDVAHRAVVDEAVAGLREDGVAKIVSDRRSVGVRAELVDDIDVALHQQVDRPRVHPFDPPVASVAALLERTVDVGSPRHECRGDGAAYQHVVGMDRHPVALILLVEILTAQHGPRLLERDEFHAVKKCVGHLGAAVVEALACPLAREEDEFVL